MDTKERMKLEPIGMPEADASERIADFGEVNQGYTEELAQAEAERCLQCKNPRCVEGCPVDVDIPGFIKLIREGKYTQAGLKIKETNAFPAICGRVCPQERQCQAQCVLARQGKPINIGYLERFVGDYLISHPSEQAERPALSGYKVAVVGSGPAGLAAAGDLAKLGHQVTVFEALHRPGGVLVYGIPEFRLPNITVDNELKELRRLGVEIRTDVVVGRTLTIADLREEMGFAAIFLGLGAGAPIFLGIEGENLPGVMSANEFLTRVNLMRAFDEDYDTPVQRGRNVTVIGGGNVAMDSSRVALRLGADSVKLLYRRTRAEMPARVEEVRHAEEEGVIFELLVSPVRFLADDDGSLAAVECLRMELGEPDESGRRRPVPIPGSEFTMETDQTIVAVGARVNPSARLVLPDMEQDRRGHIIVDPETLATNVPGVFAGGDVVVGEETVIRALGDGRRAAAAIDNYLRSS